MRKQIDAISIKHFVTNDYTSYFALSYATYYETVHVSTVVFYTSTVDRVTRYDQKFFMCVS